MGVEGTVESPGDALEWFASIACVVRQDRCDGSGARTASRRIPSVTPTISRGRPATKGSGWRALPPPPDLRPEQFVPFQFAGFTDDHARQCTKTTIGRHRFPSGQTRHSAKMLARTSAAPISELLHFGHILQGLIQFGAAVSE